MLRVIQGVFLIINLLLSESKSQTLPANMGVFIYYISSKISITLFVTHICLPTKFFYSESIVKLFLPPKFISKHQSIFFRPTENLNKPKKKWRKAEKQGQRKSYNKIWKRFFFLFLSNKSNFLLDWLGISKSK